MASCFDMHIAVIGAGMGGLGCALSLAKKGFRHIDVYETASDLGFVGAGIQVAPNMIRILDRLGCWAEIEREATKVQETSVRQGSSNAELVHVDMSKVADQYGYPHCTGHRSSLADGLYRACQAEPAVRVHFSKALVGIERFSPRPVLRLRDRKQANQAEREAGAKEAASRAANDGPSAIGGGGGGAPAVAVPAADDDTTTVEVDVLLGADGIKSATRGALLGALGLATEEADTGQAAYRIMLERGQMAGDAEVLALLDSDLVVRWIGERRHIIAYPVANKTVYNLSSAQPDVHFAAAPSATYTTRGSKREMLDVFADFCPLVQRLLNLVPEGAVCEWRLRQHHELPTWVHGAVALLGDACHPTLPHLSQGAAMAIEDGAVLAEVLSRVPATAATARPDPACIYRSLKTYELLRKHHTSMLVDMAYHSGRVLHLGEGAAREERDRQFAAHRVDGANAVPDKWASPDVQKMIYSYDCVADAVARYDQLYASVPAPPAAEGAAA